MLRDLGSEEGFLVSFLKDLFPFLQLVLRFVVSEWAPENVQPPLVGDLLTC